MIHELPSGRIIRARVEAVYPTIETGSVTLLISDGPYGLRLAEWDKVSDLAAWYRPHIAEWSRICAPSSSVYLWNTAEGWASIHPEMVAAGWTFRALLTWDKGIGFLAGKIDTGSCRTWPNVTEVCGFYQRESLGCPLGGAMALVTAAAGSSERNDIRAWLNVERERAGVPNGVLKRRIDEAGGAGEMLTRHSFYESQWLLPTWEQWTTLHGVWNRHGLPAGRPYLQRDRARVYDLTLRAEYDALRAEYDALRAEYDALRAEYDALRAPFRLSPGLTNVWSTPLVGGTERLPGADGTVLHPCQKPILFASRMVEASSRPGDLVFEPFGGTCRLAVACEALAAHWPEKARRYLCVEQDEDGRDYVGAVLRQIRTGGTRHASHDRPALFGDLRRRDS